MQRPNRPQRPTTKTTFAILAWLADNPGSTAAEIAAGLGLSEGTVRRHTSSGAPASPAPLAPLEGCLSYARSRYRWTAGGKLSLNDAGMQMLANHRMGDQRPSRVKPLAEALHATRPIVAA